MATTTTWKIEDLERETGDGYVFTAHYSVNSNDGTYNAGSYGSVGFQRPETLVPFADLLEETVIGWVKDQLTAETVTEIENSLQNNITEQQTPTHISGTPW